MTRLTFLLLAFVLSCTQAVNREGPDDLRGGGDSLTTESQSQTEGVGESGTPSFHYYFWVDTVTTFELWRVDINDTYHLTICHQHAWPWLWFDGYYVPRPVFVVEGLTTGDKVKLWRTWP